MDEFREEKTRIVASILSGPPRNSKKPSVTFDSFDAVLVLYPYTSSKQGKALKDGNVVVADPCQFMEAV
jgi:hypothetical protein